MSFSTHLALACAAQDGRYYEMPCKVNRPIIQLMNRPMTMLVGSAIAAVRSCKEEHFCCVELKSDNKEQDIHEWFDLFEGSAGVIVVNFKESVHLSDDCWKAVSVHSKEMTVAVVSKGRGELLLNILGSDMTYAPDAPSIRFVNVKIFPSLSGMCR